MMNILREIHKRKLVYAVIALFIISAFVDKSYVNKYNLESIIIDITIIGFLSLGQMLCILSGGIDLSVGNMASASSVFTAFMMIQLKGLTPSLNLILSVLFALVFCTLIGALNGFYIAFLRIPPLIATLGGMWIARGLGFYFLRGLATSYKVKEFTKLTRWLVGGILPLASLLFIIVTIILFYILTKRRSGRAVYAVGGNQYSAQLSGISVKKTIIFVYAASGLLAGIGGLVLGSFTGAGYVKGADGYELLAIASVVIGGVSLLGGSGDVFNAMLGVFVFRMLRRLMIFAKLAGTLEGLYLGAALIVALLISTGTFAEYANKLNLRSKKAGRSRKGEETTNG